MSETPGAQPPEPLPPLRRAYVPPRSWDPVAIAVLAIPYSGVVGFIASLSMAGTSGGLGAYVRPNECDCSMLLYLMLGAALAAYAFLIFVLVLPIWYARLRNQERPRFNPWFATACVSAPAAIFLWLNLSYEHPAMAIVPAIFFALFSLGYCALIARQLRREPEEK